MITDTGKFYIRTNKGNEIMDYYRAKDEFLRFDERLHKLRLGYFSRKSREKNSRTVSKNSYAKAIYLENHCYYQK